MTNEAQNVAQRDVHIGVLVCMAMMPTSFWLPALLGTLHDGYGMDAVALGQLAFSGVFGFLCACLFASTKSIVQLRRWVLAGCALLVTAHLSLMMLAPAVPFIMLQPLAGLGAGIGFGYVLKLCGASAHPTRNFGILTASISGMMMIGFQAVGYLMSAYGMRDGMPDPLAVRQVVKMIFGSYAGFAVLAVVLLLANRCPAPKLTIGAVASGRRGSGLLLCLGLGAVALSFMGQGGIWAFLQILGTSHGFPVAGVANAMSAFAIMGVAGSLVAAVVPAPVSRSLLISMATIVLWAGLYALFAPASLNWYIVGCAIGGFYWNFALPLMLGILARIDPSGRGAVLGGSMASLGSAFGPLLAGLVMHDGAFERVGWLVASLCAAGVAAVVLVERGGSAAAVPAVPAKT